MSDTTVFLSKEELHQLTGRTRRDAQLIALNHMGIEHKVRPDGSIVVLRAHVEKIMGGVAQQFQTSNDQPDWDAL